MKSKENFSPSQVKPCTATDASRDLTRIRDWVFDLDNTLYPADINLFPQVDRRMGEFIARHFGIGADEARMMQKQYFRQYGTTLRGLMLHHGLEPQAYLDYVHDIDLSVIVPNDALSDALAALEGRKTVFTNGSLKHAQGILDRLGIAHHFAAIFDVAAAEFIPKPDPICYQKMLMSLVIAPERATLFEDTAVNLPPAAALGMTTVLVVPPLVVSPVAEALAPGADPAPGRKLPDADIHFVTDDLIGWLRGAAERRANGGKS
jgi:putative hydrolase of the HAD superfamily